MPEGSNDNPMPNIEKKFDDNYFNKLKELLQQQGLLESTPDESRAISLETFNKFKQYAMQTSDEYYRHCMENYPLYMNKLGDKAPDTLKDRFRIAPDALEALSLIIDEQWNPKQPDIDKFKRTVEESTFHWGAFGGLSDWKSFVKHIIGTTVSVLNTPRGWEDSLSRKQANNS